MGRFNLEATLLDGVTANGSSDKKLVELYDIITFQVDTKGVTTDGATITLEVSLNGTDWVTHKTYALNADGDELYTIANERIKYVRATVSDYSQGTYTVLMMAGK
jgi:hypothetical protein